jgi:N-dimethylarginine dimethylaminohydrolase
MMARQKILMCAPDHFGVSYVINPWMEGNRGRTDTATARRQWGYLRDALAEQADIVLVQQQQDVPDMVFTANAGLVLGRKVAVSRFRMKERRDEEHLFRAWFAENGFDPVPWPDDAPFEGAGDALWDRGQPLLWAGSGFRSVEAVPALLEGFFGRPVAGLKLACPRFYHLDTCLCPLAGGYLLYYPAAFDAESREKIAAHVPPEKRIAVGEEDAFGFACNAVDLGGRVFLNYASTALQGRLKEAGFTTAVTPLSEFMKAGGGAKCLTLKLAET